MNAFSAGYMECVIYFLCTLICNFVYYPEYKARIDSVEATRLGVIFADKHVFLTETARHLNLRCMWQWRSIQEPSHYLPFARRWKCCGLCSTDWKSATFGAENVIGQCSESNSARKATFRVILCLSSSDVHTAYLEAPCCCSVNVMHTILQLKSQNTERLVATNERVAGQV